MSSKFISPVWTSSLNLHAHFKHLTLPGCGEGFTTNTSECELAAVPPPRHHDRKAGAVAKSVCLFLLIRTYPKLSGAKIYVRYLLLNYSLSQIQGRKQKHHGSPSWNPTPSVLSDVSTCCTFHLFPSSVASPEGKLHRVGAVWWVCSLPEP